MVRVNWLKSFSGFFPLPSRRQRRRLASRRRRAGSASVAGVQRLETRTLLAAPNPLALSSLDGTTGFVLTGIDPSDFSGGSLSDAGDVNGDGFDDLIIGATGADQPGGNSHGESYVVFGRFGGFASSIALSSLDGTVGFVLTGIDPFDSSGIAVSAGGDVNGDGVDDLIIGAQAAAQAGSSEGESYVVFGRSSGFASSIALSSLDGTTGFVLTGIDPSDLSGGSVSSAGDVNGDGFDDLIIGATGADQPGGTDHGEAYVVFGRSSFTSTIALSDLDGTTGFVLTGIDPEDYAGKSVSSAGDVNGDGFDDLIIGAHYADQPGGTYHGETYVVFGRSGGFASSIALSSLDGSTGFVLTGIDLEDYSGISVSGAGDVNGDGFDDVIIGAHTADPGSSEEGESYVVFGRSGGFASSIALSSLNGTTGFVLTGVDLGDQSGGAVSGAGDVNGDGFDDLIIGAQFADQPGGSAQGETYVLFGHSGTFASSIALSSLNGTTGFVLTGIDPLDQSGGAVSRAGDVNGDGFDDLIIGARSADQTGTNAEGETYVIFGGNFTGGAETQVGGDGSQTLNATLGAAVDVLIGGRGDDTLISDGGDDVLRGGEGDDVLAIPDVNFSPRRLQGGTGTDTLRIDGIGLTLDLTAIADNRVTGVELIDLGNNDNRLILTPREVLRLSGTSNTLTVQGGASDRVVVQGAGWSPQGTVNIDGTNYQQYTSGAATLNVEVGLDSSFAVISLSTLNSTNGFRLDGAVAGDRSGTSVSSAGDVNGDGFEDVIVGAPLADPNGNTYAGSSYVVFGKSGGFTSSIELSTLDGTTGFRLDGAIAGDRQGSSVSSGAGDVNGDGFDDLIVGANLASPNGNLSAGSTYVVFGRSGGFASAITLNTLNGTTGFQLNGVAELDSAGTSVSSAGDVNGDGYHDLIVGASGADPNNNSAAGSSYVLFGRSGGFASVINPGSLDGTTGFRLDGVAASDNSGQSVSRAGDVNGDGVDDLIVGAFNADPNGNGQAGSSYVLFGRSSGFASVINLSTLDATTGFRLDGVVAGDRSGISVSSAGDVNGDGFDDLIVGAFFAAPNGNLNAGSSYVVFGRSSGFASVINLSTLDGTTGFRLDGAAAGDQSGRSVSRAGDVNADGFDDLFVGASSAAPNGNTQAGSSYVLFGRSGGFASVINLSTLEGTTGFRLDGVLASDFSGLSVSSAGDVDGDGFDDLIIGAYLADPNGNLSAGSSYIVFGSNLTGGAETQVGGDGAQTLNATLEAGVDVLIGGRGDDTLVSDGGDDVLRGGEGNDTLAIPDTNFSPRRLQGGTGTDTLRLDGAGLTLDLTAIADNRITGIERIDVTGSGANRLILSHRDLLRLSGSSNTLTVGGGSDDRLFVATENWTAQGIVNIDGTNYEQYTSGAATLNVEVGLDATFGSISLSTLDGTTGFRLDGVASGDESGRSVSSAGDVNGDGFDDLIVGAARTDLNGFNTGTSYIVFGRSGGFPAGIDLATLDGTTGFRMDGVAGGNFLGVSVSGAGDVNGDGIDDLIVGARGADPNGISAAGSTYILFGRTGGFASVIDLSTLNGTTGFRLDGVVALDQSGGSVSNAGDVNGDGFGDLIVGASNADPNGNMTAGSSYVVFGRSGGLASVISLSTLDGTTGFRLDGVAAGDYSGLSVSHAGDVNGDGFDDLMVGARSADPNGNSSAGSTYIVFGRAGGFAPVLSLSTLDGTIGFRLDGVAAGDAAGGSVSTAGDVNGDGIDDLIIGAEGGDPDGNAQSGFSYLVFGRTGGFASVISLASLEGTTGFRLDGVAAGDLSGISVGVAGDVNGDGFDDLLIGARGADPNGNSAAGSSYVVYGRSGGFTSVINLSTLNGATGFNLTGIDGGDQSGVSVSSAGDVDGDGFDDLIVGAYTADPNGNSLAGESYVFFGGNFTGGAETQFGGDGAQTLTANQGAAAVDVLIGGRGGDTLISDGGPDVLRGGEGDDVLALADVDFSGTRRLIGGRGIDTLRLDTAGLVLDLTVIADNRITGIEVLDLSALGIATLSLDVREVLNISDESNTLTILANGDVVNIGPGWTQQPTEIDNDGLVFEVYTQGAATLRITHSQLVNLPFGNGADDVTIRQNGGVIEVFDNNALAVLKHVPLAFASSIVVNGAAGESNRLLVDYSTGGFFEIPFGISFSGSVGGTDTLEVLGSGTTRATLSPATGTLESGSLTTHDGGPQTVVTYSKIEPLTATGLLTFDVDGELLIGAETLTVGSVTPVDLGNLTTIAGGSLISTGTVSLAVAESLVGSGTVQAPLAAAVGTFMLADGNLMLGDTNSFAGFFSDGELHVNDHTVTLLDANEAVLGSLTVLGNGGVSGTLTAANGFLLEEGKNLVGQGTVNGEFHNDGDVSGGGAGIVFNDLVTGIGSANNVTYNGGFSPGHSPAEVFLRGTANLAASNTLFIELGGLTPGGQFDRLASTGTVNVDGTLDVSFINGFTPAAGHSFEIIGATAVNGTFDTANLPTLPLGLDWNVIYAADSVTLNVFALPTFLTTAAINGGPPNPNRSGIGTLGLTFDLPVNVAGVTTLTIFNHTTGMPVDVSSASLTGNGSPIVTWNLSSLTLPDGRYTAELIRAQVNTTVGGPLAQAVAFEFHVLSGDIDGNGRVNLDDTVPLSLNLGAIGMAPYSDGDGDGNGRVDLDDTVPLSLNLGAILAPLSYDFGDAPETGTSYPTTLANNGARHVITGNTLFLGTTRDAETDGQPDATAGGDGADEDGISVAPLIRGTNVAVTVTSSGAGFLGGWVDFNADGDWDDAGEQVFTDQPVVAGANNLQIAVPAGATLGSTFARFRLTGSTGYSYFGLAPNGEVEDYQLTVADPAPDLPAVTVETSLTKSRVVRRSTLLDRLVSIPVPTFATFDQPASLLSIGMPPRRRGR